MHILPATMLDSNIQIQIEEHRLMDDSLVYDVLLGGLRLHAVTEVDALALATALKEVIESHTTEIAPVTCTFVKAAN